MISFLRNFTKPILNSLLFILNSNSWCTYSIPHTFPPHWNIHSTFWHIQFSDNYIPWLTIPFVRSSKKTALSCHQWLWLWVRWIRQCYGKLHSYSFGRRILRDEKKATLGKTLAIKLETFWFLAITLCLGVGPCLITADGEFVFPIIAIIICAIEGLENLVKKLLRCWIGDVCNSVIKRSFLSGWVFMCKCEL